MITFDLNRLNSDKIWNAYVDIDYGRAVPERGYRGFRTFLEDVSGADGVAGNIRDGFQLHFNNPEAYTWFQLKWN